MILLKLPGIPGDSSVDGHKEWISCTSVSWDIEREFSESAKAGTLDINLGLADLPPIELGKSMDKSSVYLMQNAVAGSSLGTAEIHFITSAGTEGSGAPYLEYKLDTAIISKWTISGSEDDRPEETVGLWYSKIWMKYYTTKDGKTYTAAGDKGWDRVLNKAWSGS